MSTAGRDRRRSASSLAPPHRHGCVQSLGPAPRWPWAAQFRAAWLPFRTLPCLRHKSCRHRLLPGATLVLPRTFHPHPDGSHTAPRAVTATSPRSWRLLHSTLLETSSIRSTSTFSFGTPDRVRPPFHSLLSNTNAYLDSTWTIHLQLAQVYPPRRASSVDRAELAMCMISVPTATIVTPALISFRACSALLQKIPMGEFVLAHAARTWSMAATTSG